jgi:glycosyltransferase involved in cell wall biosynthesis
VRRGSLSYGNASLLGALRRVRPDIDFVDHDIDGLLSGDRWLAARSAARVLIEYGPDSLRSRARFRYRYLRNTAFYAGLRRRIVQALGGGPWLCTIQTQSLWNAATGRCPNIVYTDHAALGREAVGWSDGVGRPSDGWLACETAIYRDAAHVFTYGSNIQRLIAERYGVDPDRVSCGGTGPNVTPSRTPDGDAGRYARRAILFAGGDWERKGGPELLEAFAAVRAALPDATLTIAGCAPPEAAGREGVTALGRVTPDRLEALYQAASCLCVPSRLEPFGNVFVEAAHFGLPVVATTVGAIGDTVIDGVNGWRVAPESPAALAGALLRVLSDPATAQRMGAEARRLSAGFTWEAVAGRILARAGLPPPP